MAEVAVIVPAYLPSEGHVAWLNECLSSVYAQSFTNWELVVVFDGRADLSLDKPDGRIRFLALEERQGPGCARNMGVRASSAPWLLFLDADDKLKPDAIEKLYAARDERAAIYGDLDWIGERNGHEKLVEFDTKYLREFSGPQPITALHHRFAWMSASGFTEHLDGLEDLEYWIRLAEIGICGKRIDATILEYRQHGDSRQKQLELSGRIRGVMSEIRERHAVFFNGGQTMGCSSCPDGQTNNGGNPATPAQPAGTVAVRYTGLREGSFMLPPSPVSSERFYVGGKGAYLYVDPKEVQYLLLYTERGQPIFQVIETPKPDPAAQPVPLVQAPKLFEKLTLQKPPDDITGMSVRLATPVIAEQTNIPDLKVMKAMELAAGKRTTIVKLIEDRMREIQGE